MAVKIPKDSFTKAFTKTKFAYQIDVEIGKGEFEWVYDYSPKGTDDAWHPSGHCTPSVNELWHFAKNFSLEGKAIAHEPPLAKIFQTGHFWHQYLQEVCLRAGFCGDGDVERRGKKVWKSRNVYWGGSGDGIELPVAFHWVTGSADICPCEVPGHGPYLIDFKTMGSHQFRANEPHPNTMEKWECQLNTYMDFFDMERAMIVGINKDAPHDFKEFEFARNQPLIDKLYYKWNLVSECLDADIEPPEDEIVELPLMGRVNG
jgi:hypothetical protein